MTDYYQLLGVTPQADAETIQKAATTLSVNLSKRVSSASSMEKRHEAEKALHAVHEAKTVLLDARKRLEYDRSLPGGGPSQPEERQEKRRPCPYCSELILETAKKCRYCNEWVEHPPTKAPSTPLTQPAPVVQTAPVSPPAPVTRSEMIVHSDAGGQKSPVAAFLWTLFFGPLGMFYISQKAGWGWTIVGFLLLVGSGGTLTGAIWVISFIAAPFIVRGQREHLI